MRRVSEGSGPMRASLMLARRIARDLIDTGTYTRFHGDAIPYHRGQRAVPPPTDAAP